MEVTVADPFVIETIDLRKHYDGVEALRGLDLQVPAGSICGFLGRNGAGKTHRAGAGGSRRGWPDDGVLLVASDR